MIFTQNLSNLRLVTPQSQGQGDQDHAGVPRSRSRIWARPADGLFESLGERVCKALLDKRPMIYWMFSKVSI